MYIRSRKLFGLETLLNNLLGALLNMFGSLLDILLGYSGYFAEIIGLVSLLCHETQL